MRRMIMRTVPVLLVFLFLFCFTACGRELQNDTDIGNTAAVSSDDRPDKGKLAGGKGQADQADQEMSGPLAKKETQEIQKEQKALLWLQEYMVGYAPQAVIAAAYLGYREVEDTTSLIQWIKNNALELVKEMPFILTIPPECLAEMKIRITQAQQNCIISLRIDRNISCSITVSGEWRRTVCS